MEIVQERFESELALQSLLHDFHVQQPKEAAAEAEAERDGVLRLVEKRRVVQLQFSERVAQRLIVVGKHGKQSREHHRLDGLETRKRSEEHTSELQSRLHL